MRNGLFITAFIAISSLSFADPSHAAQTACKTDSFGTQRTTGKIGDKPVNQTCKTNSFGSTYCH